MIPLKTIAYILLLLAFLFGSIVYHPLIGVIGYIFTYNIDPVGHWWGSLLIDWGIRYSLFLAVAIGLGIVLHKPKVKFKKLFGSQEILLAIFLGLIWLSIPLGLGFNMGESNALKMTKVVIVILMASHVITELKQYEAMIWTLIIAGLYLGIEAHIAPGWMFAGGRLDRGIGGSDFSEGNILGTHFAMLLTFIGIMFLKGGWKSKVLCLISGVFAANSIIQCRSRGVFVSILAGIISAIIFSIPRKRIKIFFGLGIAMVGAIFLTDPGFWNRMEDISFESSQLDISSKGRVLAWEAALSMASDYPLGIGEGNFKKYVGQYNPDIPGKDTHNTFLRCLAELGVQGFFVHLLLIINAFNILRKLRAQIRGVHKEADFIWHIYGLTISLIVYISAGMFITQTYIEELYWLLLFPVFLKRSVENQLINKQPETRNYQLAIRKQKRARVNH